MSNSVAVKPARKLTAVALEQVRPGEWHVLELQIADGKVTSEVRADKAYYRDLAEGAAGKVLRRMGRK